MPARNRFQLGGALGGYVAGLQDAAELSLTRSQAQRTGQQAGVLAEERELLKGQRREWEANVGLRRTKELQAIRGADIKNEALAYDLAEARRTQNLRDAIKIANLEQTRTRTGAAQYELSEAVRTQNIRDAQKLANLQATQAATEASEMATMRGVAEYKDYVMGSQQRSAERRAAIAEAGAKEKYTAREMRARVRAAELNREINQFKLRVIQDDNKLDREAKDITILLAKKDQASFEAYKKTTDDDYIQRYETIEDAAPYLNRKLMAILKDPKTLRQQILNTAKAINSRSTVKQVQDQILLDILNNGASAIMDDPNKFWFMMFSRTGIPNDPMMPMMWDKLRTLAIGSDYSPTKGVPKPDPATVPLPPPPEKLTADDIEQIEGLGREAQYDFIYGAGSLQKAKDRVGYKPERDEPVMLKEQEGPGFGERLSETLLKTPPGAYSYEDLRDDLARVAGTIDPNKLAPDVTEESGFGIRLADVLFSAP